MTNEEIYDTLGPMCKSGVLLSKENTLRELRNMSKEDRDSMIEDIKSLDAEPDENGAL